LRTYLASAIEEDIGLSVSSPTTSVPGLSISADHPWVKVVAGAVRAVTGKASLEGDQATTHAGLLAELGVPSLVLGPGEMGQAHTRTESLDLRQLEQAAAIYLSLMQSDGDLP
jgi:acetylornithine deacetylase/succinyl-diaminopimelate desuccinylase-like protein